MLLEDISHPKQPTFAAMRFDGKSKDAILKLSKGLPERTQAAALHVTLIYSKKPVHLKGRGTLDTPIMAKAKKYSIFTTDGGGYCLVLELDAPEIVSRHKYLMDKTGASYDHDEFHPHVTLSYNVGPGFDLSKLPPVNDIPVLTLNHEYAQKINPKWAETATEV